MKIIIKKIKTGLVVQSIMALITVFHSVVISADQIKYLEDSWYVGSAIGTSLFDPVIPEGASISDDRGQAFKIYAGVDISNQIGIEAFWSDMGSSAVTGSAGNGKIKYSAKGINGVYHLPVYAGKVHPFGKLGIAKMDAKTTGTVNQKQQNDYAIFTGIGAEYDMNSQWKVRAEYEYFTEDISQLNLGLNWSPTMRMHYLDARENKTLPVALPAALPAALPVALPINYAFQTSKTVKPPEAVSPKKVVITKKPIVIKTLNSTLSGASLFSTGSASLSSVGIHEIDQLINITRNDGFKLYHITISGHTDNQGYRVKNIQLSKNRAESVARFLQSRGIQRKQMSVVGYGESQPVADNGSVYGRAKNRRVELQIKGSQTTTIAVQ